MVKHKWWRKTGLVADDHPTPRMVVFLGEKIKKWPVTHSELHSLVLVSRLLLLVVGGAERNLLAKKNSFGPPVALSNDIISP